MATLRQMLSFGPGVYRGKPITAQDLKAFAEGTNQAIAKGLQIPLLRHHAKINANDRETEEAAKAEGAGFVKRVILDDKFQIGFEADGVPEEVAKRVKEGTDRFSSPEFRRNYKCEKEGVYCGPVIRHFAITAKPGNPDQSPLEVMALEEEGVFQFDESDREGDIPEHESEPAVNDLKSELATCECGGKIVDGKCDSCGKATAGETPPETPSDDSQHAEQARDADGKFASGTASHEEITQAIHEHLKSGGSDSIHALRKKFGGKHKYDPSNPLAHPVHKALAELHKQGKVSMRGDIFHHVGDSQHAEENVDGFGKPENDEVDPATQDNPDMPPVATDKSKVKAILAGLEQKNIVLPSDFDFASDGALDVLIAAINSSIAAENKEKAETEEVEPDPTDNVMEAAMPFSEQELADLPPKARKVIEEQNKRLREEAEARKAAEAKALQFAEQERIAKNENARREALSRIESLKLPPSLKAKLKESYEGETAIQFSEGSEQPTFTGVQVAEMVAATLPPSMQFLETSVSEATPPTAAKVKGKKPDGSFDFTYPSAEQFFEQGDVPPGHMPAAAAEALVRELVGPPVNKNPKTINERVAEENQRVPNRVMNN